MTTDLIWTTDSVEELERVQGGGRIRVRVHDSKPGMDDEHKLIARYVQHLACASITPVITPRTGGSYISREVRGQYERIAELEARNRDIMKDIQRVRKEQENGSRARSSLTSNDPAPEVQGINNPVLAAEIGLLRQRRDELESRMISLQASRGELTKQLQVLTKLIKTAPDLSSSDSPNSASDAQTVTSTPQFDNIPYMDTQCQDDILPRKSRTSTYEDGHHNREEYKSKARFLNKYIRQSKKPVKIASEQSAQSWDLPATTDSLAEMRTSLDGSSTSDAELNAKRSGVTVAEYVEWKKELQNSLHQQEEDFMNEIRMKNYMTSFTDSDRGGIDSDSYVTADDTDSLSRMENDVTLYDLNGTDSYDKETKKMLMMSRMQQDEFGEQETDQESYIRTDDEDGGNTDWEDVRKRWINR